MTTATHQPAGVRPGPGPMILDRPEGENPIVEAFVAIPFPALPTAAPPTRGWGPSSLHHADPSCARHGVGRGQLGTSARIIAWFEHLGRAHDVRRPAPRRLARLVAGRDQQG